MEVKISNLLRLEQICLDLKATNKISVIKEMISMIHKSKVSNPEGLFQCLLEREELETTGIGDGIALPHGRTDVVKEMIVLLGRSNQGIDYKALDDKPVNLLFMIVAPKNESTKVLKMLAKISRFFNNSDFRQQLMDVQSPKEALRLFQIKEE